MIRNIFSKPKVFQPDFPIIQLFSIEDDARNMLSQFSQVSEEEPDTDRTIAQKLLVAETEQTRITVGIWNGRVRFTNYLTQQFNHSDELKGKKLSWFVNYYGGLSEFDSPNDTGYTIFCRNPVKKILIIFGIQMGPVRVIDRDSEHWPDE